MEDLTESLLKAWLSDCIILKQGSGKYTGWTVTMVRWMKSRLPVLLKTGWVNSMQEIISTDRKSAFCINGIPLIRSIQSGLRPILQTKEKPGNGTGKWY